MGVCTLLFFYTKYRQRQFYMLPCVKKNEVDVRASASFFHYARHNIVRVVGYCTPFGGKGKKGDRQVWICSRWQVAAQAKSEGIDCLLKEAGFELRIPACSACLGMNEDKIPKGNYCASTSNRNFEGREGVGRTHFLGKSAYRRRYCPRNHKRCGMA